jgi:hypothetical protein
MTAFKTMLQILTFAAIQLVGASAWALPEVIGYGHFTDRFSPNAPAEYPDGNVVQVYAVIESSDPLGSPTISAQAVQGNTTLTLDLIPPVGIFRFNVFYKLIELDPGLTGPWEIISTDGTGTGLSIFTNPISEPEPVPFVENIKLQGAPVGGQVSWSLPNLDGFDVDEVVGVRILETASGNSVFQSPPLPLHTTSFAAPNGVLQGGVEYVYMIMLGDYAGDVLENVSKTFSAPFRYTIPGDFNTDGTVDAADYVVWRNGLGTTYTQNDYGVWRSHFGATLGSGSASAIPSAEPLSATVPEPSLAILLPCSMAPLFFALHRRGGKN